MTISVVNKEKALLAFLDNDLASLGIKNYPREVVVEAIKKSDPRLAVEGQQVFSERNHPQFVDYNVYFKQYIPPNIYHPVTMFVRVTDEPHKFRMFQLSGDSYFTLPQAVNLLNGRSVCKPELVDRSIKDMWFHLDQSVKDIYGNWAISKSPYRQEQLEKSLGDLPIKEVVTDKQGVLNSLKNGDLTPVTLIKDGIEFQDFAHVRPNQNEISLYKQEIDLAISKQSLLRTHSRRMNGKKI